MSSITCYRVRVPEGRRLSGFTTAGQRVPILPGEYLAHRVEPKVPWLAAACCDSWGQTAAIATFTSPCLRQTTSARR